MVTGHGDSRTLGLFGSKCDRRNESNRIDRLKIIVYNSNACTVVGFAYIELRILGHSIHEIEFSFDNNINRPCLDFTSLF